MSEAFLPLSRLQLADWLRTRVAPVRIRGTSVEPDTIVMSALSSCVTYEPGEMIVQVEAGMSLRALDHMLESQKQWIPTLQPEEDNCTTVGAALAVGRYHPRDRSTISLRTAVLGGEFCAANGELFRSGSRVVKSVAGYDTHRAFVGSYGALGVIVEVTLRVLPRPEKIVRFTAMPDSFSAISDEHPSVLEHVDDLLLCEISGFSEDVAESLDRLRGRVKDPLDSSAWAALVKRVRYDNQVEAADENAVALLHRLRSSLDQEGRLAGE